MDTIIRNIPKTLWLLSITAVLLVVIAGLRFSQAFHTSGYPWFFALTIVFTAAYPFTGGIILSRCSAREKVLYEGLRAGILVSAMFLVDLIGEYFLSLPQKVESDVTIIVMLSIFLVFAVAAYLGSRGGSLGSGIAAALLAGAIGTLFVIVLGAIFNLMFLHRLEFVLQGEYLAAASHLSLAAFTFQNTIDSALTHLVEVPILATMFGFIGSGVCWIGKRR